MKREPIEIRFWKLVDKNGPVPAHVPHLGNCWIWKGATKGGGRYGGIRLNGKMMLAHRVAFLLAFGRWPNPQALHKCDNGLCVRIDHLFEGTRSDNFKDCYAKGRSSLPKAVAIVAAAQLAKTHCKNGHEFSVRNTRIVTQRNGHTYRCCRRCQADKMNEYRRKRKHEFSDPNTNTESPLSYQ